MVLLIICIFFAPSLLKTSHFGGGGYFSKGSHEFGSVYACFVPPPPTKKAIAKKNLEADNENFSFPFYDLMGPPCAAHSVNAA